MRLLSHPFRFTPNGHIATVEQDSDIASAEQIIMLMLTRPGDRVMVPDMGIEDPTFEEVDTGAIMLGISLYGPKVSIDDVRAVYGDPDNGADDEDGVVTVTVSYNDLFQDEWMTEDGYDA